MSHAKGLFFSVVIPLYNKADVIERALWSVARQSCREFELIVVDDGSTDSSVAVVEHLRGSPEWRETGVELRLVQQKNSGASAARNRGAKEAVGKFVTMLDGDDEWLPNHLSDLMDVYSEYPEAKVMTTNSVSVYERIPRCSECNKQGIGAIDIFDFPEGGYPISSDTITIDRELFLALGGYDPQYSYYEDREFYYRLGDAVGNFYVNWRISAYYHHDAACSANKGRKRGYAEYGFLCLAERRVKSGIISARMKRCAILAVNNYIRGNVVRFKFDVINEMKSAFPVLSNGMFAVRWLSSPGFRVMVWFVYFAEWLWVRGGKCFLRKFHA